VFTHRNRFVDGIIRQRKCRVAVDFDNTMCICEAGKWPDVELYPGVVESLVDINRMGYLLYVLTGRPEGKAQDMVREFLAKSEVLSRLIIEVTNVKHPDTILIIDDRAYRFNGNWDLALPEVKIILNWHETCADSMSDEDFATVKDPTKLDEEK